MIPNPVWETFKTLCAVFVLACVLYIAGDGLTSLLS